MLREQRRRRPRWRRERGLLRNTQRMLAPWLGPPLVRLASRLAPPLYLGYMRLVRATSRVTGGESFRDGLFGILDEHGGFVGALWHEEVTTIAYGYAALGFRPHTLASRSNAGDLITRVLERCGFVVFRGGSSGHDSRRHGAVLGDMIEHMKTGDRVLYGITVDGSNGPPYRMKRGALVIARECRMPIVLARTWYRRSLRLPTWDRTAIPLPLNEIRYSWSGPYFAPPDAGDEAGLERFRRKLEAKLIDLAAESYEALGRKRPPALRAGP